MKEKILAELKKKYPGLPVQLLGSIAEKMSAKVTEESAIEGAITELENSPISISDMAAEFQKEGDRRATEADNKRETTLKEKYDFSEKKTPTPPDSSKKEDSSGDNGIAELKAMLLEMKQKQDAQEAAEAKKGLFEKLKAKATEKKIPESFLSGRLIEKEEDIDTVFSQVEADYNAVKQHFIDQGMSESSVPLSGSSGGANGVSSMMKDYLSQQKQEQK